MEWTGHYDFTIFGDDDLTPLFGSADSEGDVVEADFSTDGEHPRPYLKTPTGMSTTEIRFATGSSVLGAGAVEVVDMRTDPTDQWSGIVTSRLRDVLGRRCVLRKLATPVGGEEEVLILMDGIVYGYSVLPDEVVGYRFDYRDARERERGVILFDRNETFCLWPDAAPLEPYGRTESGEFILPAASIGVCQFSRTLLVLEPNPKEGIFWGFFRLDDPLTDELKGAAQAVGQLSHDGQEDAEGERLHNWTYPGLTVRWRPVGGGDWKYIRDIPALGPKSAVNPALPGPATRPAGPMLNPRLYSASYDSDDLPAHGQTVEMQALSAKTSRDFPKYWDRGTFADLAMEIYDGAHSSVPPRIRYNVERYEAWSEAQAEAGLWARFIEYGEAGDMRSWVEKNIYQATAHAPGLDEKKRIVPVPWSQPEDLEDLPRLDPTSIVPVGSWEDSLQRVVNQVIYKFRRENMLDPIEVPNLPSGLAKWMRSDLQKKLNQRADELRAEIPLWSLLEEQEVDRERRIRESIARIGPRPLILDPVTVRSIGEISGSLTTGGEIQSEVGAILAETVSETALALLSQGGAVFDAGVLLNQSKDIQLGDYVYARVPWMPSLVAEDPWPGEDFTYVPDPDNPQPPPGQPADGNLIPARIFEFDSAMPVGVTVSLTPTGLSTRTFTRTSPSQVIDLALPRNVDIVYFAHLLATNAIVGVWGLPTADLSSYDGTNFATWEGTFAWGHIQSPTHAHAGGGPPPDDVRQYTIPGVVTSGSYSQKGAYTYPQHVKGLMIGVLYHGGL